MIDRRELLEKSRDRNLPLTIVEKDYVLGWLLFGFSKILALVFKGGTALSKIYFPQMWKLSEDLDFACLEYDFGKITDLLESTFTLIREKSGIVMNVKNEYSNPEYLQLKIQYSAILGKNWIKVDATKEEPKDTIVKREIQRIYSDYTRFTIKVESLEEILAEELRALLERRKCRDYYDVWKLLDLKIDKDRVTEIFSQKCKSKGIEVSGIHQFFPQNLNEILKPYWERELGRLVFPVPDMESILDELQKNVRNTLYEVS